MSYYYGNRNPLGGSAFQRGKGGKLLPAKRSAAQTAYRNRRSNERADRRSIAMGGGRG
jgi:hypothetical protein